HRPSFLRLRRLALGIEDLGRTGAPVGVPGGEQPLRLLAIDRRALALKERALVPGQPEPLHRLENRPRRLRRRALLVGVLDAQDELAAVVASVEPVEESRARPTDVEKTGR